MWIILILTAQMEALQMVDPASHSYGPYGHQTEQQQSSSCLPVQEQYTPAVTVSEQQTGPIATIPYDIDNIYDCYVNLAYPNETASHQQQPTFPNPNNLCQIAPSVTSVSSNTAYSTGCSSGANVELALSSELHFPAAHPSQTSPLLPGPLPLACPERQEMDLTPSRVRNSPRSRKLHIIWMFGRVEL
jgi:hypothetical protein